MLLFRDAEEGLFAVGGKFAFVVGWIREWMGGWMDGWNWGNVGFKRVKLASILLRVTIQ
jgi:hypothetical protein